MNCSPPPAERDCPIPDAHRRLEKAHRFWHEAAQAYSDPEQFRTQLNETVQAMWGCLWMLQKRTRLLLDFQTWHESWHEAITGNELLRWLLKAGSHRVEPEDLEKASSARVRLMLANKLPPLAEFSVPVLWPVRDVALSLTGHQIPPGAENPRYLVLRRRWAVEQLTGWELLEALAEGYAVLAYLLRDAHQHSGDELVSGGLPKQPAGLGLGSPGRLPCMAVTEEMRTVVLNLRTGRLQGPHSQWIERDRETGDMVATRFGGLSHLHSALVQKDDDPLYFTAKYFEDAKRTLAKEKMLPQTVRLYTRAGKWLPLALDTHQQDNYSLWQRIAHEVQRNGADAILVVCEVQPPSTIDTARPQAAPLLPRPEVLVMMAETADGRHRTLTVPFSRRGDRIRFGRTRVDQDGRRWHQLEPVRTLWSQNSEFRIQNSK